LISRVIIYINFCLKANLLPVSTTLVKLVAKLSAGVVDTGGKFLVAGVVGTSAQWCTCFFIYIFWWRYAALFTFIFFLTIHYRTWLDHITQYMMRLRLADDYE
jgi:hypothetical protein